MKTKVKSADWRSEHTVSSTLPPQHSTVQWEPRMCCRERERSMTEEIKQEGGEKHGKYSAVQFLDEQAQMERLPAGTAEDKNNLLAVFIFSLMKPRQFLR